MPADDRGFGNVLTMIFPSAKRFEEGRDGAYGAVVKLIGRTKVAEKSWISTVPRAVSTRRPR
jgi:hypothetical protein